MNAQPQPTLHPITVAMFGALAAHDLNCAERFLSMYREPSDNDICAHILAANRFWRLQLGEMQVSTIAVRENLLDNCNPQDWVRLFATEVAPCAAAFNLPRVAMVPALFPVE